MRIAGSPDGWTAELSQTTAVVRITGAAEWVDGLTADDMTVTCDVSGLAGGVHEVALQCVIAGSEGRDFLAETEPQTMQVTLTAPATP